MMEEQRISDRHIQETADRAKAKLDVQQTQQVRNIHGSKHTRLDCLLTFEVVF